MPPYASTHGRRFRRRRFSPLSELPRFAYALSSGRGVKSTAFQTLSAVRVAEARYLRLFAVASRTAPLPPMVGASRWPVPRHWRAA